MRQGSPTRSGVFSLKRSLRGSKGVVVAIHRFETDKAVEMLLDEQAHLTGEEDFDQNIRKALALRFRLWQEHALGYHIVLEHPDHPERKLVQLI